MDKRPTNAYDSLMVFRFYWLSLVVAVALGLLYYALADRWVYAGNLPKFEVPEVWIMIEATCLATLAFVAGMAVLGMVTLAMRLARIGRNSLAARPLKR